LVEKIAHFFLFLFQLFETSCVFGGSEGFNFSRRVLGDALETLYIFVELLLALKQKFFALVVIFR